MKQRLLVMNGQRVVQIEQGGKWETNKVEKAGTLRAGLYNIHQSTQANKTQTYEGLVLHANKDTVYQQIGKTFVKHSTGDFEKIPEIGSNASIKYLVNTGTAVVTQATQKMSRSR